MSMTHDERIETETKLMRYREHLNHGKKPDDKLSKNRIRRWWAYLSPQEKRDEWQKALKDMEPSDD